MNFICFVGSRSHIYQHFSKILPSGCKINRCLKFDAYSNFYCPVGCAENDFFVLKRSPNIKSSSKSTLRFKHLFKSVKNYLVNMVYQFMSHFLRERLHLGPTTTTFCLPDHQSRNFEVSRSDNLFQKGENFILFVHYESQALPMLESLF